MENRSYTSGKSFSSEAGYGLPRLIVDRGITKGIEVSEAANETFVPDRVTHTSDMGRLHLISTRRMTEMLAAPLNVYL